MKAKDESQWQQQMQDFAEDPDPKAAVFRDFVLKWADLAEAQVEAELKEPIGITSGRDRTIRALRDTLREVEGTNNRLPIGYIGMALLVFATHWKPVEDIDAFYQSMTPIEQNLYADVASVKFMELHHQASEERSDE